MVDNENSLAELIYALWRGNDDEPLWENLDPKFRNRWLRLAVYTLHREVDLVAKLANDRLRKKIDERLLRRLERWEKGKPVSDEVKR